jgi:tRNA-Thr(GGU) m(6)t(6)A37 methyltransferase TsaA
VVPPPRHTQAREGKARSLRLTPIGVARTPFQDRRSAPRQPAAARGVRGTIELHPRAEFEHALEDLAGFSHVWVIFWFHRSHGFRPKVEPPRSEKKRGLFATRAPYRPNPLGLSVLTLERIEGRVLHVRDVDLLDGTPILDIKPYLAYADAIVDATSGWLSDGGVATRRNGSDRASEAQHDPGPRLVVRYAERAEEQLQWLAARMEIPLRRLVAETLAQGVAPHPYRRIRREGDVLRLGVKDFRVRFRADGGEVTVLDFATGYRAAVLRDPAAAETERTPLAVHRAFVRRFGARAAR